mmetsp:Transcript_32222/g.84323  ORF Transcript_32222/g.84323 Transcript_32222/m.84323 type:complete len:225 (-) Transcript_32222:420-1094(-)
MAALAASSPSTVTPSTWLDRSTARAPASVAGSVIRVTDVAVGRTQLRDTLASRGLALAAATATVPALGAAEGRATLRPPGTATVPSTTAAAAAAVLARATAGAAQAAATATLWLHSGAPTGAVIVDSLVTAPRSAPGPGRGLSAATRGSRLRATPTAMAASSLTRVAPSDAPVGSFTAVTMAGRPRSLSTIPTHAVCMHPSSTSTRSRAHRSSVGAATSLPTLR